MSQKNLAKQEATKKVGDNHPQHEWLSPTYYCII